MQKSWRTKLIHSDVHAPEEFHSLNVPIYRASTTVFPSAAAVNNHWDPYQAGYTYGLYGTPTTLELAGRICELEGGYRTLIVPGGQSAISLINFAFLRSGDHVLVPQSIYGPNRRFANHVLRRFGVEVSYYDPLLGREIASLIRPNTRLIWCESPGRSRWRCRMCPRLPKRHTRTECYSRSITRGLQVSFLMLSRTEWT